MCTIMQKDVLIEMVADTQAIIAHRTEPASELNEDQKELVGLRSYLYGTSPDKLDFQELSDKVNNIRNKYISLPVNKHYL
ncbi:MAG TPA: hypothetical protein DD638_02715 [Pasteurellaceae bacterium]|nr:hypothetical protein [Pasteurellaceae bacterium]